MSATRDSIDEICEEILNEPAVLPKPTRKAGVIPLFTISDAKERPEEREHFVRYGVHVCGPGRCDRPGSPPPVLVAARVCVTHGVAPIPVPAKQKGPRIKEWQKLRLTEQQLADSFAPDSNIGILNGDDIGHEIVPASVEISRTAAELHGVAIDWHPLPIGRAALDTRGHTLPPETLETLKTLDGWILGPIGHRAYPKVPNAISVSMFASK